MKHLKSTLSDLRKLFESSITVKDIAEPLASFDAGVDVKTVQDFMDREDYDVIGVRRDGLVDGYAVKNEFLGKTLGENIKSFEKEDLLDERTLFKEVFRKLKDRRCLFILILGRVGGIVTRGDLQKVPVRMWLFGLVSLIEMQSKNIISFYYKNEKWKSKLKRKRLKEAHKIQKDRKNKNLDIGLVECLQFCDLRDLINCNDKLRRYLNMTRRKGDKLFKDLEENRNKLAHAQDIITGNWPGIVDILNDAESLLNKLEKIGISF
jgi:hypothetical protein